MVRETQQDKIEETVNLGGQDIRLFSGNYGLSDSIELYNRHGYFGYIDFSKDVELFIKGDVEIYDAAIKELKDDVIEAVNSSLNQLGYENVKYDGLFRIQTGVPDHWLKAIDVSDSFNSDSDDFISDFYGGYSDDNYYVPENFKHNAKLLEHIYSTLNEKYNSIELILDRFIHYFLSTSGYKDAKNVIEHSGLSNNTVNGSQSAYKKAFYDDLVDIIANGKLTRSARDTDIDLIYDVFYRLYNEALENTVNFKYFKGKYSDFIKKLNDSDLKRAKETNDNSKFYVRAMDDEFYIGVQMLLTPNVEEKIEAREITKANVKTLCNSLLKELAKN